MVSVSQRSQHQISLGDLAAKAVGLMAIPGGILAALLLGWSVVDRPVILPLVVVLAATTLTISLSTNLIAIVTVLVPLAWIGCMTLGKSFVYLGFHPLYIGELILALGILTLLFSPSRIVLDRSTAVLLLFCGLGLILTIRDIPAYGMNAIRDAAIWYYAGYALLVTGLLTHVTILQVLRLFASVVPVILAWQSVMSTALRVIEHLVPHFPGSPVPFLSVMGPSHRAVVLAIVGAFLATDLYNRLAVGRRIPMWLLWSLWLANVAIIAAESRGGFLAIVSAMFVVALLRPSREILQVTLLVLLVVTVLLIWNPQISLGYYREFSVRQIWANLQSVILTSTDNVGGVSGSKSWRLDWWSAIWNDVIHGPYFWSGRGFGENLASAYNVSQWQLGLRSPHNGHLTILARMGVIGLVLWVALNASLTLALFSRMRRRSSWVPAHLQPAIYVWLMACLAGISVDAFFDVYLEGPYGAIIYWTFVGIIILVCSESRDYRAQQQDTPVVRPIPTLTESAVKLGNHP